jgi:hypothetical protein
MGGLRSGEVQEGALLDLASLAVALASIAVRDARGCRPKSERDSYGKSFRRIASDGRRWSAFGVTELGVWYGGGESGVASDTAGAGTRSRRSSSIRARITGKSSAARGRVMFPPFDFS